jgi:hypothetical protein
LADSGVGIQVGAVLSWLGRRWRRGRIRGRIAKQVPMRRDSMRSRQLAR